jgi:predicted RND superfamily exporter protein
MTSLTTILGLLPLVFQKGEASDLWRPLALTVISGLAFSTMLTLVVIPCCYILLVDFQNLAVKLKESRLGLLDVAVDWWKKRQKAAAALPARPVPAFLRNRTR